MEIELDWNLYDDDDPMKFEKISTIKKVEAR